MAHTALRLALAFVFAALGVAGAVLPILPGWLFFAVAVLLLFPQAPITRNAVARLEQRLPSAGRLLRFFVPTHAVTTQDDGPDSRAQRRLDVTDDQRRTS